MIPKLQWPVISQTDRVEVIDLPDRYISRLAVPNVTPYLMEDREWSYPERTENFTLDEE